MEQIDLSHIQKHQRELTAAWRRWEEDRTPDHRVALVETLTEAQAQLAAWETPPEGQQPHYGGHQTRLLADQIKIVAEVLVQHDQQKARGY